MSEKPETLPLFEQFLRGGELLRPAVSYSGYYVSNYGRIFSLGHHHRGPQELKIRVNRHGYRCAWLYLGSQKYKAIKVARLVADAFLQPSDKKFVLHNDGIRTHDVASNLRWGTHQENMADMVGHEKSRKGERHPSAKLKAEDVKLIRELSAAGMEQRPIARRFGVSQVHVGRIVRRDNWGHI